MVGGWVLDPGPSLLKTFCALLWQVPARSKVIDFDNLSTGQVPARIGMIFFSCGSVWAKAYRGLETMVESHTGQKHQRKRHAQNINTSRSRKALPNVRSHIGSAAQRRGAGLSSEGDGPGIARHRTATEAALSRAWHAARFLARKAGDKAGNTIDSSCIARTRGTSVMRSPPTFVTSDPIGGRDSLDVAAIPHPVGRNQ